MEAIIKEVVADTEKYTRTKEYFPSGIPSGAKLRSRDIECYHLCIGMLTYTVDFLFEVPKKTRKSVLQKFTGKLTATPKSFHSISKKYNFNWDCRWLCRIVDRYILTTVTIDIKAKAFDQLIKLIN